VTQKIASLEIERISEDCYRLKKVEIKRSNKIRGRDENPWLVGRARSGSTLQLTGEDSSAAGEADEDGGFDCLDDVEQTHAFHRGVVLSEGALK